MFCPTCGMEIHDEAVVCIHCGCATAKTASPASVADAPDTAYAVLGFFIPIVGLILYITAKDTTPLKAASAGKGALAGFITGMIFFIMYIGVIVSLTMGMLY